MPEFTGQCLCGQVSYKGSQDTLRIINCHCSDCQQYSGAAYTTNIFVDADNVDIQGDCISYSHSSDSGSTMTKHSCSKCGSSVWGTNTNREGVVTLRAGTIDQKEIVKPMAYVYCDRAMPATPMDDNLKQFARMPG